MQTDFARKYRLDLRAGKDFMVRENHRLPVKMGAEIFVFGKTMYCRNSLTEIPRHEYLHIAQFRKYGSLLVLIHYTFYLTVNFLRYRNFGKAFRMVPFEVEARDFEESSKN